MHKGLRNLALFGGVAAVWLLFDRLTKLAVGSYLPGQNISESFLGLFHFRLLFNTGGAWSIFDDATMLLAAVSALVCLILFMLFLSRFKRASVVEAIGFALVFSGGIGNLIDRLLFGHVVDFICLDFISFPVFNIADIGVTCGFALLFIGILLFDKDDSVELSKGSVDGLP